MTIKILLVDDQEIVRAGLRLLLQSEPDMQVVGEAGDEAGALDQCRRASPDVVVMGLEHGGVCAISSIKREQPDVFVVALSTREDRPAFFEMAQAGASAHLPKYAPITDLVNTIRAVRLGQIVLHPSVAAMLVQDYCQHTQDSRAPFQGASSDASGLTPHELDVLAGLADGAQNKEIAQHLGLSLRTVARCQASLLRKLDLNTRAELVRYALEHSLQKSA